MLTTTALEQVLKEVHAFYHSIGMMKNLSKYLTFLFYTLNQFFCRC